MAVKAEQLDALFLPRGAHIRRSPFALAHPGEPMGVVHDEFRRVGSVVFTIWR